MIHHTRVLAEPIAKGATETVYHAVDLGCCVCGWNDSTSIGISLDAEKGIGCLVDVSK